MEIYGGSVVNLSGYLNQPASQAGISLANATVALFLGECGITARVSNIVICPFRVTNVTYIVSSNVLM